MADNDSPLFSERRHQRHHVADVAEDAVRIDIGRRAGSAETPHIGCGDMEARSRKRLDLMPPRMGQFRPAMARHQQRTCSSRKISIPLAEMVRGDSIAFPPCFGDFVAYLHDTIGSFHRRRNRIGFAAIRKTRVVCGTSNC